jgi:hypothetical protein
MSISTTACKSLREVAVNRAKAPTKAIALIAAALLLSSCVADYGYGGPVYLYDTPDYGYEGWGGWHRGWDHGHWHGPEAGGHAPHVRGASGHFGHGFVGHGGFGGHGGVGGHAGGGHR